MKHHLLFGFLCTVLLLNSCQENYDARVAQELASGKRNDSLFLGMYLGMPRADFYQRSWQLYQQNLVTSGPEKPTLRYNVSGFEHRIDMNFYPAFEQDRIFMMDVVFCYEAWAPWSRNLFADKLVPDVLKLLNNWYSGAFFQLKTETGKPYWALVQGNREIRVTVQNERNVHVEIRDLTVSPMEKPVQAPGSPRALWKKRE